MSVLTRDQVRWRQESLPNNGNGVIAEDQNARQGNPLSAEPSLPRA